VGRSNRHVAAHDEAGDVVGLDGAGRETLDIIDHRQHQFLRRAAAELPGDLQPALGVEEIAGAVRRSRHASV